MINLLWAKAETAKVAVDSNILSDILGAGPVVQLLLLLLVFMSIFSWAVMYTKYIQIKTTIESDQKFEERFWKTQTLQGLYDSVDEYPHSAMARVFKAAYMELQKIVEASKEGRPEGAIHLFGYDNLERSLRKSIDLEVAKLESKLGFLATTGSTSPFIGLLGTVIGIMTSFRSISATGSASLAVVAPGISEALFATAVGLVAAIPAVMAYNHFINKIRRSEIYLNSFSHDFLNIAKRNFFRDAKD